MRNDWLTDVVFLLGLAALAGGVYYEFGPGWALSAVGIILLAISLYGSREP